MASSKDVTVVSVSIRDRPAPLGSALGGTLNDTHDESTGFSKV